jgi:hypothetical protein
MQAQCIRELSKPHHTAQSLFWKITDRQIEYVTVTFYLCFAARINNRIPYSGKYSREKTSMDQ